MSLKAVVWLTSCCWQVWKDMVRIFRGSAKKDDQVGLLAKSQLKSQLTELKSRGKLIEIPNNLLAYLSHKVIENI